MAVEPLKTIVAMSSKNITFPSDCNSEGIEIEYIKSRDVLRVHGFYNHFVGIEGSEITVKDFADQLGIDLRKKRKKMNILLTDEEINDAIQAYPGKWACMNPEQRMFLEGVCKYVAQAQINKMKHGTRSTHLSEVWCNVNEGTKGISGGEDNE
jgi:hypothetical protein